MLLLQALCIGACTILQAWLFWTVSLHSLAKCLTTSAHALCPWYRMQCLHGCCQGNHYLHKLNILRSPSGSGCHAYCTRLYAACEASQVGLSAGAQAKSPQGHEQQAPLPSCCSCCGLFASDAPAHNPTWLAWLGSNTVLDVTQPTGPHMKVYLQHQGHITHN